MPDMADRAGGSTKATHSEGLTRGFLFADLRGYTSFVESRGASAAAQLLDRYRVLVREQVARFEGAEIKTEGDSFYVVFGSVSRAVDCALGVVERAARATDDDPGHPIRVGIGVHAGETVETSEGYVGSAVNMAARLCSAAAAGEVLVSDTVRAITANTSSFGYEAMGRRRLKGITDAVTVYRARPAGTLPARSSRSRRTGIVAAGASLVFVVVLAVALRATHGESNANPGASPSGNFAAGSSVSSSPSAEVTATPLPVGPLAPGEYTSVLAHPDVTFRVGDGWTLVVAKNQITYLTWSAAQGRDLYVTRFVDPIEPDNPSTHVSGVNSAAEFVAWLAAHPYLSAGSPYAVDLEGSRGLSIDFTANFPESASQPGCPQACIALYWIWESEAIPPDRFGVNDGSRYRLLALDRQTSSKDTALMIVVVEVQRPDEFDTFVTEAEKVISTIRFTDD